MKNTKLSFHTESVLNWLKTYTSIDVNGAWDGFEYIPHEVVRLVMSPDLFGKLYGELVWFTDSDLRDFSCSVPNLYIMNPRTPETSSLVRVVSGNDSHVKFTHVYDDSHMVCEMTNRQFVMNSQKV